MTIANAFAAALITAAALCGQSSATGAREAARADQLLSSFVWEDRAWGAFFAGRLRSESLNAQLVEQVRLAATLQGLPAYTPQHAFIDVLFDALIESGISVPAALLEPFERNWPVPVLILAARNKDGEDLLFEFAATDSKNGIWLAAQNLLFKIRSQRWYETLWPGIHVTSRLYVTDDNVGYGVGGGIGGSTCCGDGVAAMPKGFPPVGLYALQDDGQEGSVLLAEGPTSVYYKRTVVPTDRQVGFGSCFGTVDRESIRIGYLARLAGETDYDVEHLLHAQTNIKYAGAQDFSRQADEFMRFQGERIRNLIQALERKGLRAPEAELWIRPEVVDRRRTPDGALPALQPRRIPH